jgi:hypothetical protein
LIVEDEDMREVAEWIIANLPFDRLYFYDGRRPIHISYARTGARKAYHLFATGAGNMIPRPFVSI